MAHDAAAAIGTVRTQSPNDSNSKRPDSQGRRDYFR
jgi:hypothetical protein